MYQNSNDEDEFEPRVTPKPASRLDGFIVPSVPEVSLIFDKPSRYKSNEERGFTSPSIKLAETKGIVHRKSISPCSNTDGSYAAWKEQNFSWKPSVSKIADSRTPRKKQYNPNDIIQSCSPEVLKECIESNYTSKRGVHNVTKCREQRIHDVSYDNSREVMYQAHNDSKIYIKQKHNMRTQCNGATKNMPRSVAMHPNTSCSPNQKESPFTNERKLTPHNSEQQRTFNGPISKPTMHNINANSNMLSKNECQPPPHLGYQYPYFDMNTYPFPQIYATACSSHNTDNQETVKNLLQLVNSQSEQIKSLQLQVDRLLKMQEDSIKEKQRCTCISQLSQQNEQLYVNSCDTIETSSCITRPQNQNTTKDMCQNTPTKERNKENFNESRNSNHSELVLAEAQPKKTFMEQKVSIGVMTSFEFTVQNSPFALDTEDYENKESQQRTENLRIQNGMNLCDTNETLRRYKNSFTRMPSAQLENIVEDSESYLSSSQQQSSNLNASVSTKDFEKQTHIDTQRETDIYRFDSPKPCESVSKKLDQNKIDTQRYMGRISNEEMKSYNFINSPVLQKGTEDYKTQGTPTSKGNNPSGRHQYINMQRHNSSTKVNSKNSPTDYPKHHQKEEDVTVSKQTNCVEDSLILSGGDLKVGERPPPTPEPSIHVDLQEYSSDDDSEKVKRTSKVGWTFYNNVLGQVNQILQNSCVIDDQEQNQANRDQDDAENRPAVDTVKVATLEQLRKLGISLSENPEMKELNRTKKMAFDSSFYPRLDCQANMMHTTSAVNETNTSMHMKALALKYLSDEQLAELALQRQGSTSLKHLMLSNVQGTNMSFATMRYLERYQLLPGKNNPQIEGNGKGHIEVPPKSDVRFINPKNSPVVQRFPFSQTPRTTCPSKILDISTLKQQPKLL